ncbi:FAD-dependent oxidoreductase [Actinospica sp.]|uniref:oxidoreductase n=1 Tax=Actinospica sp. TaxID=1872142 RepID=UPI002CF94BC0|nr:FAD-dependent oxidoreductase [Actinospica sp.]HWG22486.1 FAD-dependent oxidoreductase [Actinospica sp.]
MNHRAADPLMQPFDLRHLRLRNRIVSTSHEPAYAEDGMPKRRYALYHAEKAKGGAALTMIGGSAIVAPDSPPSFGNLHLYKDEIVPWLGRVAEAVHEHGAYVMCQITHLGRRTSNYSGDWLPLVAASPLKERAHRAVPKQAEEWDLTRIAAAYAQAAARCAAGGMDGIEIEAYGHLFDGFLSPATNLRTDEWGGSLENRLRFPRMVVRAIRDAVGPDFIVGLRPAVDELLPGGLSAAEGMEAMRRLAAEGIDFLSVIRGHIDTDAGLAKVIPPTGTPSAPHLDFVGQVRRELGIPVMHASRIADVATARHAVANGLVDLIGMTRAQLADPHLASKIAAGQEHRIRPCVGAGYCLDAIYQGGDTKCIHNPSTGRELQLPHTVTRTENATKRVVVVGAGPAGLEAARVLGERGHAVTLLEAADTPGGQLLLASRAPARRELIGIVDWRVAEFEGLDVKVRCNTFADEQTVLGYEPDVVIVATGGIPDTANLGLGAGARHVIEGWDVLSGAKAPRGDVLFFDDNGGHAGLDAARALIEAGARLEYVTPERILGPDIGGINYPLYAKVFAETDTRTTLLHELRAVEKLPDGRLRVLLYSEAADRVTERIVDHVVAELGTMPNDEIYFGLLPGSTNLGEVDLTALLDLRRQAVMRNEAGGYQLFRIGDAVTSRNVHAAVYDAFRLCLAI